ncbi:hypothetical protein MASR2M36_23710 [Providencia sp.]
MMKRGKSNHIWPAYVDMMTVLLLVYVLVSLLFAMMIKENIEAEYKEKLDNIINMSAEEIVENKNQLEMQAVINKENAEMNKDSDQRNENENSLVLANNTAGKGNEVQEGQNGEEQAAKAPQREEIVLDDNSDMLEKHTGDFILPLDKGQELLTKEDKEKLGKWYQDNLALIERDGIDIGVILNKDSSVSLGAIYRKQYIFYMDILRLLVDKNKNFEPSNYIHRSPTGSNNIDNEYLLFRIKPETSHEQ